MLDEVLRQVVPMVESVKKLGDLSSDASTIALAILGALVLMAVLQFYVSLRR